MERQLLRITLISLLRPFFLIVIAAVVTFSFHQEEYLVGWILGVLAAWLNYSALIASVRREKVQTPRNRLTFRFFWRYLLIGALLFTLQLRGTNHLIGFIMGFAVSYASWFVEYLIRLKKL